LRGRWFAEALANSFGVDVSALTQMPLTQRTPWAVVAAVGQRTWRDGLVLSGRSKRELVLRTTQPKAAEPKAAPEMGNNASIARSVATGLFEGLCAGDRTGNIAGISMNAARDLAGLLFGTAAHLVTGTCRNRVCSPYSICRSW